jgi:hypothetical protein
MLFLRGSVFSYARPAQLNAALIARALIERQIFSISSIILNALSANVVIRVSEATKRSRPSSWTWIASLRSQ